MAYSKRPGTNRKPDKKESGTQLVIAISLVILLLCGVGFAVFHLKKNPDTGRDLANYRGKMKDWWVDRKSRLSQGIANARQAAHEDMNTEPVVKFEFYHTLPNMQMMQEDAETQIQKTIATKAPEIVMPPKLEIAKARPVVAVNNAKAEKSVKVNKKPQKTLKKKIAAKKPQKTHTISNSAKRRQLAKHKPVKKKVKNVVVSRASDLEKDLLATMQKTSRR